jgi:glycosyl transferase family 2
MKRTRHAGVTFVMTSCGRQDLLEITLDSFLYYNTHPIREYIIIEDGDGALNSQLMKKYRKYPFRWLDTKTRLGQIAAIDIVYGHVRTEYIFHCEDDWKFTAPGFIEKSLPILEASDDILQVYLRALTDVNGHPILDEIHMAGDATYRLFCHYYESENFGTWHGLSWNPGLRRWREYELIGSFGSLDPDGNKIPWVVEREGSEFYQKHGYYAAILIDNDGKGYVRHLGAERHIPDETPAAFRECFPAPVVPSPRRWRRWWQSLINRA